MSVESRKRKERSVTGRAGVGKWIRQHVRRFCVMPHMQGSFIWVASVPLLDAKLSACGLLHQLIDAGMEV